MWRCRPPDFSGSLMHRKVAYNSFRFLFRFAYQRAECHVELKCLLACVVCLLCKLDFVWTAHFGLAKLIVCACSSRNPGQQSVQSTVWCLGSRDHHVYIVSHIHTYGACLCLDVKMCACLQAYVCVPTGRHVQLDTWPHDPHMLTDVYTYHMCLGLFFLWIWKSELVSLSG